MYIVIFFIIIVFIFIFYIFIFFIVIGYNNNNNNFDFLLIFGSCIPGECQPSKGKTKCIKCEIDFYSQSGSTECSKCPKGKGTSSVGSGKFI